MFRKLLKFLFFTRFTKPLIIGMILFLAYATWMGIYLPAQNPYWKYYVIGILVFFLILMIPWGGVAIMKSDMDYLFNLPFKRSELAVSLYVTQFFATGISFLFSLGYVLPYLGGSLTEKAIIAGDIALIALFITALSIIAYRLSMKTKLTLLVAMVVWTLLPLVGFQYSYSAIFTGNILIGSIFILAINIPSNYFALKELGSIELGFTKVSSRSASLEYKNQKRYGKYSPIRSIYTYYLSQLNISARINLGGTTGVTSSRVRLAYLFLPMLAISIVYAALALMFETGEELNIVILLGTAYISTILPILFSQGVLTYERAWLAFTSIPAPIYWRHVILSKYIQIVIMISPFAIVGIYLHFNGVAGAINTLPLLLILAPSASIIFMFIQARLTMEQIKEPGTLPSQFSLRQVIVFIPIVVIFIAVLLSLIVMILSIIISIAYLAVTLILVFNKRTWTKLVYKLTENGYV